MVRIFNVKPVINKTNHQINISLPKKKLPKKFLEDLDKITLMKLKLEDWS